MRHNKDGEQNLFRLFGRFSALLLLCSSFVAAGSFEDFKQLESASFSQYKDERDNAFKHYLKEQWRGYEAYITAPMYAKPKPKSITPLQEHKVPNVGPVVQIILPKTLKPLKKAEEKKLKNKAIRFDFFGTIVGFDVDKHIKNAKFYPPNQAGIANFFSLLAQSNYKQTLSELQSYTKTMALNDWAVYLLVKALAHQLYANENEARIYTWFLLSKLTYNVKIALSDAHNVFLLHYTKEKLYGTPRYNFNGKYYYLISRYNKSSINQLYTYKQDYPNATKALDFSLSVLPHFAIKSILKERSFKEYGKIYTARYHYNKNIVDFMNTYPQVDYKVYFNAPMEQTTYRDLAADIKKYTDGKKMSEAMNFVLRFVQKAFVYERDEEQFGHEKVMFAEETLAYRASDCEDRAILFSYLIKKLFGVRVVGVKYSDHMSTALYIPMQGDSVMVKGRRFVMADPTYINANIGQEIPRYKAIEPDSFIYMR